MASYYEKCRKCLAYHICSGQIGVNSDECRTFLKNLESKFSSDNKQMVKLLSDCKHFVTFVSERTVVDKRDILSRIEMAEQQNH